MQVGAGEGTREEDRCCGRELPGISSSISWWWQAGILGEIWGMIWSLQLWTVDAWLDWELPGGS